MKSLKFFEWLFGLDQNVPIQDQGKAWSVGVNDGSQFQEVDAEPVPLDEGRGIFALMGQTRDGDREVFELRFQKDKGWDLGLVRSFLAKNGFDAATRTYHDRDAYSLEKRVVKESEDYWVIPDSVLTREGVMNGGYKPWAELRRTARMWDNVPIIYPHPADIVTPADLAMVGGFVRNVRLDEDGKRILGDYWLARRPVADFQFSPEAIQLNQTVVERVRAGKPVDNSIGFQFRREAKAGRFGDRDYDHTQRDLKPDHLAILSVGSNRDQGACNWDYGCGVARAQERLTQKAAGTPEPRAATAPPPLLPLTRLEAQHGPEVGACVQRMMSHGKPQAQAVAACLREHRDGNHRDAQTPQGEGSPQKKHGDPTMPCATDCAAKLELASNHEHLKELGGLVGVDAKAGCAAITERVKAKLERLKEFETQDNEQRADYALETALLDQGKTLGKDGDFEDAEEALKDKQVAKVTRELAELPWAALRRVRAVLDRAKEAAQPKGRDGSRLNGANGHDEQLGIATAAKVWPKKKGDA